MAEIHRSATLTPPKVDLVSGWIGSQRWYAAKGLTPRLAVLHRWRLDDPEGEVGIETLIVADSSGSTPVVYQVPLTYRGEPLDGMEGALIGTLEHSVLGTRWVYDGPHDPAYATCLIDLAQGRVQAASSGQTDAPEPSVTGTAAAHAPAVRVESSRVLSGEQSNTSVIAIARDEDGAERPVICKVFRTLAAGDNPDVLLQGALAEAGCLRVPASLGSVTGTWTGPDGRPSTGHLAFVQEFLPGAQDAWRVALLDAGAGRDFAERASALGEATAEVHALLASTLPTEPATPARVEETLAEMRGRLLSALTTVPDFAARAPEIEAVLEAARAGDWPAYQRIHGDYHLGQVLDVPERGWVLLDFEGEPLRPLAERTRTDQWMRDVAGMLRSFDYAGGSVEHSIRGFSAREWVRVAQESFLDGYASRAGIDPRSSPALLAAFQIDKALYEVTYEARNRPTWLAIPTAAIDRLLTPGSVNEEEPQ